MNSGNAGARSALGMVALAGLVLSLSGFGGGGSSGGEAIADTSWSVLTDSGDIIRESVGAFASMVLAEGDYAIVAKNRVKLLLNLVMIAQSAIPRGGLIDVVVQGDGEAPSLVLKSKGSHARIPAHVEDMIAGTPENGTVDAHGILPFYAGLVARAAAMDVRFAIEGDTVTITATPTAAAIPEAPAQAPAEPEADRPSDSEPPETALA